MRVRLGARGPAPAATAWERYADVRAWPGWSPQIAAVHVDGGVWGDVPGPHRLRTGLRGTVIGALLAGRPLLLVDFVVEDVDGPGRRWTWSVVPRRAVVGVPEPLGRWARLVLVHAVLDGATTGSAASGSRTTLELTGPAPVVLGYALPAWLALRRLVR